MRLLPRFSLQRAIIISVILVFAGVSARAQTTTQLPSDWTNALGSLADKIAAVTKRGESLSLEAKNMSSLGAADVDALHDVLVTDLARRNRRITKESTADATLQVTFSEAVDGYLWIAEILDGAKENVVMVSAPRSATKKSSAKQPSITLLRKLVWEQDARILDFGLVPDAGAESSSILVILEPYKIAFYDHRTGEWRSNRQIDVPHPGSVQRNVLGRIDLRADTAALADAVCSGTFQRPETVRCESVPQVQHADLVMMQGSIVGSYPPLTSACGGSLTLSSGPGDWTEPDFVQAYADKNRQDAVGQPVQFPGPIFALWVEEDGKSARAVSRNLQTGKYEASIVSVSCSD